MRSCEWLVCEHSGRWAAALRAAVAREFSTLGTPGTIHEVRSLRELSARLVDRPGGLGLIELQTATLHELLAWLAEAPAAHPSSRFFVLLGDVRFDNVVERNQVMDAARSAGAVDIAESPRHLQQVLRLGRRHAEAALSSNLPEDIESFADWAWAWLPWQDAKPPIL